MPDSSKWNAVVFHCAQTASHLSVFWLQQQAESGVSDQSDLLFTGRSSRRLRIPMFQFDDWRTEHRSIATLCKTVAWTVNPKHVELVAGGTSLEAEGRGHLTGPKS